MLRTIKSHYAEVRFIPCVITYTGGTPAITQHKGNFRPTVSNLGTGQVGLVLRDPGARVLGAWATAVTDKFVASVTTLSLSSVVVQCADNTGVAANGDMHVIVAVQDLKDLRAQPLARHSVSAAMQKGELFVIQGNTTSPSFSNNNPSARDATIAKNGTGDVTITFDSAFSLPPVCIVRANQTGKRATLSASARGSIRVKIWDGASSDNASDGTFTVFVFGQRSTHQGGFKKQSLKNGRLRPRLIPFQISGSALTVGSHVMTLGGLSSGTFPFTYNRSFIIGPVVIAGGNVTGHECVVSASSTTGATILTQDAQGSTSGSTTVVYGLAVGWMDDAISARF